MLANQEETHVQNKYRRDENIERMYSKTRNDGIGNERSWEHLEVAPIDDKVRETCLRWLGHIRFHLATALVKKTFSI